MTRYANTTSVTSEQRRAVRVIRYTRQLAGPPNSWRHIWLNLLLNVAGSLAANAVLIYGLGMSWQASASLLAACIVCCTAFRLALSQRRHHRRRAERRARAAAMFGDGHDG